MQKAQAEDGELQISEKKFCTIRGRVTYARGSVPLADVKVARTPAAASDTSPALPTGSASADLPRLATTDLAGTYEISNLEPGTYEVMVTPPKGWNYKAEPQSLELAPGEVKLVDFTLEEIPLETIVEGCVFDSNGLPAKNALLEDVICDNKLVSTVTDPEGRFTFKNVTPGKRFVRVNLSGHLSEVHDFTIEAGEKITRDFTLKKAAHRIQGSVVNEEGRPVEATVQLFQGGPLAAVIVQKAKTTNENSSFEFNVKEGDYSILVQAGYYELASWTGSVSEDMKLRFQLTRIDPGRHVTPLFRDGPRITEG